VLRTVGISLLFLAGALAAAILVGATLLGLPSSDLPDVALLLAGAGGGVGLVALVVVRPAVLGRLGGVRAQLVGAGLIGSLLLLGMMLAGSRAMFISGHDFAIVLTMLLFAAVLSVGFSLLFAAPIADRIERVRRGAARLKEPASRETSTAWPAHSRRQRSASVRWKRPAGTSSPPSRTTCARRSPPPGP
jgi:hypothetical protein